MILLIDNYDSFTYNLFQAFIITGVEVEVVRNDKITIDEIKKIPNLQGIVLSPGPGHPTQSGICLDIIRELGMSIPVFGVCLGHQAIGHVFGGTVDLADKVLHGKPSDINHKNSALFQNMSTPFTAARYHSLVVKQEGFPDVLNIDATDNEGNIMALSHKEFPIFGVQFHPESILTPDGQKIVDNFVEFCKNY